MRESELKPIRTATEFGKFLRNVRLARQELLKYMADKLGVASSFLSAVENGKQDVPEEWLILLQEHYMLTELELEQLRLFFLKN